MSVVPEPLLELSPITDLFAEDIDRIEVLGDNVRLVYWRRQQISGCWQRVALEWAIILPLRTFRSLVAVWPEARVVRPPEGAEDTVH
jgi:hypothetical protein